MAVWRHARFLLAPDSGAWQQLDTDALLAADDAAAPAPAPAAAAAADALPAGLSDEAAAARLELVGANVIDVPLPPAWVLLAREAAHPFIFFQVFAVIVWLSEGYITFSLFILASAVATAVLSAVEVRRALLEVRRLSRYVARVRAWRGGREVEVESTALVPGDVLLLSDGMLLPCDAVLLRGSVMVDEASLTGEAVAVRKVALAGGGGSAAAACAAPAHVLFGGARALRVRGGAAARVVRTGFESVKGRLVLALLYPRPLAFRFLAQALAWLAALGALAAVGFAVNCVALAQAGAGAGLILQRGLDMVTIVVPPSLPLALSAGVAYALVALRRARIACVAPPRINLAGKVNAACFDKTGTLTVGGLRMACVRPAAAGEFAPPATDAPALRPALRALLAACHSLDDVGGALAGDPLELETVAFARATIDADAAGGTIARVPLCGGGGASAGSGDDALAPFDAALLREAASAAGSAAVHIERLFEFDAALARQGVVVRAAGLRAVFVKGAPEAVARRCDARSLPADFIQQLGVYAARGMRVLAAAARLLTDGDGSAGAGGGDRHALEDRLVFLGLLVLDNALREVSAPTIARLQAEAGMPCTMITGDHAVAAVAVARGCGIVPPGARVFTGDVDEGGGGAATVTWRDADGGEELDGATLLPPAPAQGGGAPAPPFVLALTGNALAALQARVAAGALAPRALAAALLQTRVFARMTPEAKAAAVTALAATGHYVLMVGDGANDALALRAAHVGLALCAGVDAAVSAPFTSLRADGIACVPELLAQGRGALATSFGLFQFMVRAALEGGRRPVLRCPGGSARPP